MASSKIRENATTFRLKINTDEKSVKATWLLFLYQGHGTGNVYNFSDFMEDDGWNSYFVIFQKDREFKVKIQSVSC